MVFNVMLQLCKITRSSKLFQRNFYLPLLKPLSPKDALRRHIITGKNVMGQRIEHYIPVFEEYSSRSARRRTRVKGKPIIKKRIRMKDDQRYMAPFFDDMMENHGLLQNQLARKKKAPKGQSYVYYVPDKDVSIVLSFQWERAIKDKDIVDIMVAQRSEKIIVRMRSGLIVTVPLCKYEGRTPLYRGDGWTTLDIEDFHHHGKETFVMAKIFEAKEAGVEEWELEMMRIANKRKKKHKGEDNPDWKTMMQDAAENMDWDQFEEDSKQIVEEINEVVDDEPIEMEVDEFEKTRDVAEKLKALGDPIFQKLPVMREIPEVIKNLEKGQLTEVANVSGMAVTLPSSGKECFVAGQIVKSEEGETFVPGQTIDKEGGGSEYTPGFTVFMDDEPTLLPGLVMGDDPNKPMFLPGDSAITENGQLQFEATEDDVCKDQLPVESEAEEVSEEEDDKPLVKKEKKELVYERPKRLFPPQESQMTKRKERVRKKPKLEVKFEDEDSGKKKPIRFRFDPDEPVLYDLTSPTFEKDFLLQEKERVEKLTEKSSKYEYDLDKKRKDLKQKAAELIKKYPKKVSYQPIEPVEKSAKLKELEKEIKKGNFFDVDYKQYLKKDNQQQENNILEGGKVNWLEPYDYRYTFDSVGLVTRHLIWKSVR